MYSFLRYTGIPASSSCESNIFEYKNGPITCIVEFYNIYETGQNHETEATTMKFR